MTDPAKRNGGLGVRSIVRLLVVPGLVGAVAAACTVPLVLARSSAGCVPDPDDQFACLGEAVRSTAGTAFLVAVVVAVCWIVLAWIIGSWRAPAVTMLGGMVAVTASVVLRAHASVSAQSVPAWSAGVAAVSFMGVSAMLLPRLPTAARILFGGLLMTVVVWASLLRF